MENFSSQLDRTDELPVISEEAIRAEEQADRNATTGAIEELLEVLWDAFERTDQRWQQLEARLAAHAQALERLCERFAVNPTGEQAVAPADKVAHLKFMPAAADEPESGMPPAPGTGPDVAEPQTDPSGTALRARLRSMETHIAERSQLWRSMKSELETQARRIALLERELGTEAITGVTEQDQTGDKTP